MFDHCLGQSPAPSLEADHLALAPSQALLLQGLARLALQVQVRLGHQDSLQEHHAVGRLVGLQDGLVGVLLAAALARRGLVALRQGAEVDHLAAAVALQDAAARHLDGLVALRQDAARQVELRMEIAHLVVGRLGKEQEPLDKRQEEHRHAAEELRRTEEDHLDSLAEAVLDVRRAGLGGRLAAQGTDLEDRQPEVGHLGVLAVALHKVDRPQAALLALLAVALRPLVESTASHLWNG